MEIIKNLIAKKYKLINVLADKKPPHKDWTNLTPEVLECLHDLESDRWALFMGEHPNGRKLFCLDFDVNSSKAKCEKTKTRFEDYIDLCGEDGVFMGSTLENGAVIVDYTDCEGMCGIITELCSRLSGNSFKCKLDEMEIFMGNKSIQILPPTKTICKVSGTADRNREWLNDVPIVVLENDSPETCCKVRYFSDIMGELFEKHPKREQRQDQGQGQGDESEESKDGDKWVKLLMNYLGNPKKASGEHLIDRTDFLKIGACLKSNGYSIEVWKRWVELDARNGDGEKTWNSLSHTVHRNILRSLCKKYKPDNLRKWTEDFKLFLTLDILNKGTNDIGTWCVPHFIDNLRCYKKVWWEFKERKGVWEMNEFISEKIVSFTQQTIDESVAYYANLKAKEADESKKGEIQKIINQFNEHRKSLSQSSIYKSLEQFLRSKLYADDKWLEQLNNNPYKIAYKNGILNLRTLEFREGLISSDYITHTLPFKYKKATKEDKDWVSHELKKICNWKKEHYERYLGQLGYAFCGDASKVQEFYNMKGEQASNGKSTPFDVLTLIAPNYVIKLNSNTFEKANKGMIHKTIATLSGKRLLWLNEMDETAVQDEGMLKNIRDGTQVSYPVMYGISAMMTISGKLFMIGNSPIHVKGDNGILRSLIINQFDSNFNDKNGITEGKDDYENLMFYSDPKMIEKLAEKKEAFLELIFEYSKKFADEGKLPPVPKEWKNEKEELRENLCKFDKWFQENFVFGANVEGTISKHELETMIKEQKIFKVININTELKRMKLWNNPISYDSQAWNNGHKGIFKHIHLLEWEEKR